MQHWYGQTTTNEIWWGREERSKIFGQKLSVILSNIPSKKMLTFIVHILNNLCSLIYLIVSLTKKSIQNNLNVVTKFGTCGLYHPYSAFPENQCIGVFDDADYESELGFSISYHCVIILSPKPWRVGGGVSLVFRFGKLKLPNYILFESILKGESNDNILSTDNLF